MPIKATKKVKRKHVKKKSDKKLGINIKHIHSSARSRKKRQSRSKRRGSASKKKSFLADDTYERSQSKKKFGIRSSFSPSKDFETIPTGPTKKTTLLTQNFSKSNISLHNVSKKIKHKHNIKKNKHGGKLTIKKDRIKSAVSKSKKAEKSPIFDKLQYQTLEPDKYINQFKSSSPLPDEEVTSHKKSNSREKYQTANEKKDLNFLSIVEKNEHLHKINKQRRMKTKDNSLASTNTGNTNSVAHLTHKIGQNKFNRPFSGEPPKGNKKIKSNFSSSTKLMKGPRPKTAKFDKT